MCDGIAGPFVLGALRPKIYLPCWLGEESRAHVLAHERCHLRRHDPLIRLIALFTTALHWFNPLVLLGFELMEQDMEMSCDEAALRALGAESRRITAARCWPSAPGGGVMAPRWPLECPPSKSAFSMC